MVTHATKDSGTKNMEKLTITQAFNKYFGKKPGQTMPEFSNEIKAAVAADRPGWVKMFATVGFEIVDNVNQTGSTASAS